MTIKSKSHPDPEQSAGDQYAKLATLAADTVRQLERIIGELRAVPVNVEIKVVPVQENSEAVADPDKEKLPVDVEGKVEQG